VGSETDCGPNEKLPLDDDADTRVNDGCTTRGTNPEAPGTTINEADIWSTTPGTGLFWQSLPWAAVCVGGAETGTQCAAGNIADEDGDGYYNDACPMVPTDDDADTTINDGCPQIGAVSEGSLWCGALGTGDGIDQDADTTPDDGCAGIPVKPVIGISEAANHCADAVDDDGDATVNDGCPQVTTTAESAAQCNDPETVCNETECPTVAACDNDNDGSANDGCPGVIGALDDDADGYCDALENMLGSPTDDGPELGAQCIDAEDPSCVNSFNDDPADDAFINDGCPAKGTPESVCTGNVDDDADTRVNDGCEIKGLLAENDACANDTDQDGDTYVNDGCPTKASDDDKLDAGEGVWPTAATRRINDGCPPVGAPETNCTGAVDDDADTYVNDGCGIVGDRAEAGWECIDPESVCNEVGVGVDDDGDTNINDGCPVIGTDDDADTRVNDGCVMQGWYAEVGAQCANNTSDDTPAPDFTEVGGPFVNDGCPVIGVPESLVIDATMLSPAALPSASPPASCSDGVDNDGDTTTDTDDQELGCNPDDDSYDDDADFDGVPDATDNCPSEYNPEQTDTDGGDEGDACDTDDDDDGFSDQTEWWVGTDPLVACPAVMGVDDAWPLDQDMTRLITGTGDVYAYVGKIGCSLLTDVSCRRLDLDTSGLITGTGDVYMYVGKIGNTCTPTTP
jgi:hypothetical protein